LDVQLAENRTVFGFPADFQKQTKKQTHRRNHCIIVLAQAKTSRPLHLSPLSILFPRKDTMVLLFDIFLQIGLVMPV